MSKLKTKSGAKKRFKFTASGKIKMAFAFKRHNLRKRSQKMKRKSRGMKIMCVANTSIVQKIMPYNKSN